MTTFTDTITAELQVLSQEEKRRILPRFFKTGKGEYGEGDKFLGEVRLCALLIMVERCKRADNTTRKAFFNLYLSLTERINNWDLVDLSCRFIVGEYLLDKPRDILYRLADSPLLWDNRIAIVSTYAFIRLNQLDDTFALATQMMAHPHDLMHKAIGWMLREAGKRDEPRLHEYILHHRREMSRTMLRYAIEKFSPQIRAQLMARP